MRWIFSTFFVKFVVETFFFNKVYFSEVLGFFQWVSFSDKDYYVLLLVLLVLNKLIEISNLTKRNLNFKCEVKSHKFVYIEKSCYVFIAKSQQVFHTAFVITVIIKNLILAGAHKNYKSVRHVTIIAQ